MSISYCQESKTKYVDVGSGEAIIFIHGVGMDHTMWQYQINYFSQHYRVIAYDMIGHGESEKPNVNYKLNHLIDQLNLLLESLEIDKAHIVGFSMGGMVAQLFGLVHPNKVKTLSFMSTVADRSIEERNAVLNRVKKVEQEGHDSTIEEAIYRWFNKDYLINNPDIINQIKNRLRENEINSYLKAYKVFATADQELWPKLKRIKAPSLIITGEKDLGSNPDMAWKMKQQISNSEIFIIPGYKHMIPIEGYEIINRTLHNFFLKEV